MSRIWYLVILLAVVLIVWIVVSNDKANGSVTGPPLSETVGFESIEVNSRLISQLYAVTETVRGFRVYNAFLDGENNVGLVIAALDSNSSEIFDDGQSFYIPVNKDGEIMATLTRDLAERMVLSLVDNEEYRPFISSFYAESLNDFWRQGTPDLFRFIPSLYEDEDGSVFQNVEISYIDPSDMMGDRKLTIKGRPCPPICPSDGNFLYEPNREPIDVR